MDLKVAFVEMGTSITHDENLTLRDKVSKYLGLVSGRGQTLLHDFLDSPRCRKIFPPLGLLVHSFNLKPGRRGQVFRHFGF